MIHDKLKITMQNHDELTGVNNNTLHLAGQVIFLAQKIEQRLKRIIFIRTKLWRSNTFADRDINKLTFNDLLKEVETYNLFTGKGMEILRTLQRKRNYVSHQIFLGVGFDEQHNPKLEHKIHDEMINMRSEFAEAYKYVYDAWVSYENSFASY